MRSYCPLHFAGQEMRKGNTPQTRIWMYEVTVPTPACDIAFCVGEFDVIQGNESEGWGRYCMRAGVSLPHGLATLCAGEFDAI